MDNPSFIDILKFLVIDVRQHTRTFLPVNSCLPASLIAQEILLRACKIKAQLIAVELLVTITNDNHQHEILVGAKRNTTPFERPGLPAHYVLEIKSGHQYFIIDMSADQCSRPRLGFVIEHGLVFKNNSSLMRKDFYRQIQERQ